jgi:hypothetical protein
MQVQRISLETVSVEAAVKLNKEGHDRLIHGPLFMGIKALIGSFEALKHSRCVMCGDQRMKLLIDRQK